MITPHDNQGTEQQSHSPLPHELYFSEESLDGPTRPAWYKRPSIAWIVCIQCLAALSFGIMSGPYVEVFTDIVCRGYYFERLEPDVPVYTPPSYLVLRGIHAHEAIEYSAIPFGRCASDPRVQAEVARVGAVFATAAGILSILTAGWWGGFMDRYGRTRVLGITICATLLGDLLILLVFFYPDKVPGGYWLLIVTPIVQGILGAPSSDAAAETAYVRDVSAPQDLSRNLTWLSGIFHAGWTVGPVIGGFLNEQGGSVITALYVATFLHVIRACIIWFALPESDDEHSMLRARTEFAHELAMMANADVSPFRRRLMMFTKMFWDSFPLHVLAPRRSPHSPRKKDWNLTLLVLSGALIAFTRGSMGDVFQYTLYTFEWSSLQLGYFISATGFSSAVFLMLILPAIVRALKHTSSKLQDTGDLLRGMTFDLRLLRMSSLVIVAGYILSALAPTGFIFTLCYMTISFGFGFLPAVHGLATLLLLYGSTTGGDKAGRLLSALSVVDGLGMRYVGPLMFGMVFSHTVSFFPTAIFWLSAACASTAFLLLAFVRLPDPSAQDEEQQDSLSLRSDGSARSSEEDPLLGH